MSELATIALRTDGLYLAALEQTGHGIPLVLLHGVAGNALSFKPLIDTLDGRHVIAVDMPFHGDSGRCGSLELTDLAKMIFEAVSAHIGVRAIWAGHSWGGKVAAIVAAQNPKAVDSLILMDPSPAIEVPIPPELAVDATFGAEYGAWESLEAACATVRHLPQYANWDGDRERAFTRGLVQGADGKWRPAASRDAMIAICAALGQDHSALIRKIDCPTLLVVADQSLGWQETTNIAVLPRAACVVLNSNHWLMADNPEDLSSTISMWLEPESEAAADSHLQGVGRVRISH
jgi:pimeloyl-ACP methyl ester carboxylesterase